MEKSEKLGHIAAVLKQAAAAARSVAGNDRDGASRVSALATQIEGIAMEFQIIADSEKSA